MVSKVINEAFGRSPWYKKLRHHLSALPPDRLVPGIPCSAIWFTSDPKPHKWHVDDNSIGAVFAFCPNTTEGGELVVTTPKETVEIHLQEGTVLGGRWGQYPHSNKPVPPRAKRHSFIVYLDKRVVNKQYWTRQDFRNYGGRLENKAA